MSHPHTYVMSIAGFDPSGGAGLTADLKTFERLGVYGLAVNTANTIQTENRFHAIRWSSLEEVLQSIDVLLDEYPVKYIKTGIMPSYAFLLMVMTHIKVKRPDLKFVVDPIIRSSTDFAFMDAKAAQTELHALLSFTYLLTPNVMEACQLTGHTDAQEAATLLAAHCNVLLKGGHNTHTPGVDYLYEGTKRSVLQAERTDLPPKHGSGCVLSAAITAYLAKGHELETACRKAKHYVEQFLNSHSSLLGTHV